MNFLEKELKKGLFQEAEKAWEQNKSKFGVSTGKPAQQNPNPGAASTTAPTQKTPQPPQEGLGATVEGEQPSPQDAVLPVGAPAPPVASTGAGAPPSATATAQASSSTVPEAGPAKKMTLKEKLLAKVGEKVSDPAMQAKAEKVLKAKAKRTIFKF